jgi:CheY-like chemotaxis protein
MSKRILVVEDQPDNRQIIRDMLGPTITKSLMPSYQAPCHRALTEW